MKRNVLLAFLVAPLLFAACGKTDTECVPATVASEKAAMVAYCTANNITYTEHASGILYEVMAPGLSTQPTLTSTVSTVYTGKLLNGTQFDASANPVSFLLSGVIKGWQIGIPLIKKGGRIKLVIPSSLAYGCNGSGSIPANSPLYFEVSLTDVR
jgi:FKBP-type peptidyl-prolyl cis-trans isomerase FkpA